MKSLQKIFTSIGLSIALILGSCTDVSETVYDQLTSENLTFSDDDISRIAGSVLVQLRYTYWSWNGLFDIQEESADLIMTPLRVGIGWGDLYISMHKHDFNAYVGHYYTVWNEAYKGITFANQLLDLEKVQQNHEQAAKIRTMRAVLYYILFDCFRNIPLITTTDVPAGYLPEQVGPEKVYNFIVSELQESKEFLPEEKVFGQINYWVAEMTLAKMYLNHNAWFNDHSDNVYYDSALVEVNDILENSPYALAPNYKDNFMADISGSPEIIFALPLAETYAAQNYLVNKCLIGAGADAFGYQGTPWNGSCAVPQFMDTYHANDQRFEDTWAHDQQYHYETGEALTTDADDQGEVNLVYTKEVHSIDNPGAYMLEGYRFVKNEIVADNIGTYGDDVPFYRLADAMFIKAECLLRLGRDEATAAQLISEVRARSFEEAADAERTAADLKGGSVYDYGHREWTSEGATNFDASMFVATYEGGDDIELGGLLDDLAWEFVGEHHRRQDLIRFRLTNGGNVFNHKSWFCKDAETDLTDFHKDVYPIYQTFLDGNINLTQNEGYSE